MRITQEDVNSIVSHGKELTAVAITTINLINASALGGPEKSAAVQAIANGVLDAVGVIAKIGIQYSSGQVHVPSVEDLKAQITALQQFKDLPTE